MNTNTSKVFFKKLKRFNKKIKGGSGGVYGVDTAKTVKTNSELAGTISFITSLSAISTNVAAPLLAASGVGIPLAAALFLISKIADKIKDSLLLNDLLKYVTEILLNCYFLEMLITLTMDKFNDKITDLNQSNQTKIPLIKIKDEIIHNLTLKIDQLQKSVLAIVPYNNENLDKLKQIEADKIEATKIVNAKKPGVLSRIYTKIGNWSGSKLFSRSLDAKTHIDNILRELSVVNSFFIFYNSQFEWLIRQTEMIINNKYKDKNQNDEILFNIWSSIFKDDAYNEYMGVHEKDNLRLVLNDLGAQYTNKLNITAEIVITDANKEVPVLLEEINADFGGKKTKKRHPRKIKKPKRKYTHRKMFIKNTFIPVKI